MIQQPVALELCVQMKSHCIGEKEERKVQNVVNRVLSGLMFHLSEISSMFETFEDVIKDHFSEEYL